ncbi:nuclear transport factor 2 family protein [Epilithonimonas zeae]|uniref:nuclear transport factor 2 family protein n=1 Tax=Epilithonimonas zeae TaxID=1416779 RepID=UPI00200F6EDA|nr:nuclear transport factor 2 family protein [Epilithonimonas zeae]
MKTIQILITALFISVMTIACNNCDSKDNSTNEQFVKKYFQLFNQHQWKALSELYVENAEFKDPSFGTRIVKQSRQEFVRKYSELNQMFPDLKDEIKTIYVSGNNNVIVEFVSTGTAPDNSKFKLPICTIFTIENGKITKDFTYYDNFDETK